MMKKKQKRLLILIAALLALYVCGFALFAFYVYAHEQKVEKHVDAIVVLTGGHNRLSAASDLFNRGLAPRLFISGVGGGAELKSMSGAEVLHEEKRGLPELGRDASNTRENALEVSSWTRAQGLKSIILVTSDYHLPRSLLEFRAVMPDMEIVPFGVAFDAEKKGYFTGLGVLFKEYNKCIVAYLRTFF